jgi:hypothetical protein
MLIDMFLSAGSRQIAVLKRALFACLTGECMSNTPCICERAAIGRHAHKDLIRRHSLPFHVLYSRVTGYRCFGTVRRVRREELSLVTALVNPRARIVVGHKIDKVQVVGGLV